MHRRKSKATFLSFSLLLLLLAGLLLVPQATSYTAATVANRAMVRITDEQDALVAVVPSESATAYLGESAVVGHLINNLSGPISIVVLSDCLPDVAALSLSSGSLIPGESVDFLVTPSDVGNFQIAGKALAEWAAGRVEVPYRFSVSVLARQPEGVTVWNGKSLQIENPLPIEVALYVNGCYEGTVRAGKKQVIAPYTLETVTISFKLKNGQEFVWDILTPQPPPKKTVSSEESAESLNQDSLEEAGSAPSLAPERSEEQAGEVSNKTTEEPSVLMTQSAQEEPVEGTTMPCTPDGPIDAGVDAGSDLVVEEPSN